MSQVNLKVQVHCLRPSWVNFENNKYRLYVDNDMITERSWIWNTKTLLDENIWVELELDTEHSIKIVPILDPINSFVMENVVGRFGRIGCHDFRFRQQCPIVRAQWICRSVAAIGSNGFYGRRSCRS